jgi:isopenicillin N synthase-like dioxygenase
MSDYGLNEGFAIAPAWGENRFIDDKVLDGFGRTCREYFDSVQELGRRLLSFIAEGLGVESDFFDPYLNCQRSFARLTHYYRQPGGSEDDFIGAAAHTDWGSLTLLVQDQIGGLQIYNRTEDCWIDVRNMYERYYDVLNCFLQVEPNPSAFVCNIGDLLSRWTNDTYHSTLHRVLAPPPGVDRYSIPFFNPGNPDHLVEVIPSCVRPGEVPKYKPITAGEYIKTKHYKHIKEDSTP